MNPKEVKIESSWRNALEDQFSLPYFDELRVQLRQIKKDRKIIYPLGENIFKAFELCPFDETKVVILGQDPYHNPGEAMGLSFSVPRGVRVPPSLKNIYKELNTDLGLTMATNGDLTSWASQGVLLLNAMLTVEHRKPGSHRKIGWQYFTDAVIKALSEKRENIVFLLWGNFAKSKAELIDSNRHLILQAAHPSPLARGAYFGSKHFSKTNDYLKQHNLKTIDWQIQ